MRQTNRNVSTIFQQNRRLLEIYLIWKTEITGPSLFLKAVTLSMIQCSLPCFRSFQFILEYIHKFTLFCRKMKISSFHPLSQLVYLQFLAQQQQTPLFIHANARFKINGYILQGFWIGVRMEASLNYKFSLSHFNNQLKKLIDIFIQRHPRASNVFGDCTRVSTQKVSKNYDD